MQDAAQSNALNIPAQQSTLSSSVLLSDADQTPTDIKQIMPCRFFSPKWLFLSLTVLLHLLKK